MYSNTSSLMPYSAIGSVPVRPVPTGLVGLAAQIADGYMSVQPDADFVRLYRESGGGDRPLQGGLKAVFYGLKPRGA